jgi:hypothetical protein
VQAIKKKRQVRRVCLQPFDSQIGIETARFVQGRLRIVHLANKRVSRRQALESNVASKPGFDRQIVIPNRRVEMSEAEFRFAGKEMPNTDSGIARSC